MTINHQLRAMLLREFQQEEDRKREEAEARERQLDREHEAACRASWPHAVKQFAEKFGFEPDGVEFGNRIKSPRPNGVVTAQGLTFGWQQSMDTHQHWFMLHTNDGKEHLVSNRAQLRWHVVKGNLG